MHRVTERIENSGNVVGYIVRQRENIRGGNREIFSKAALTILTNAGGPGVIATDALLTGGGELASLSPETVEALNRILRKTLKTRGPIPTDEAALKLLFLAIRNARATWGRGP
jgi:hypothetical protein